MKWPISNSCLISGDMPHSTELAVEFIDQLARDQQRAEAGAADIEDLLEVDQQMMRAGTDQLDHAVAERLGGGAVHAPVRLDDQDAVGLNFHDFHFAPLEHTPLTRRTG